MCRSLFSDYKVQLPMDLFTRRELRQFAEQESDVCISLYMPTHRADPDWSQNTTRLKNLLRDAREQLKKQGHREKAIDDLLADSRRLLDQPSFWQERVGDGLAVFIGPNSTETFRLPLEFDELAVVDDQFHVKPLFPLIAANNRFYILALSQNDVRLYQGTHQSVSEIEMADIPSDIVEAVQQYDDPERQLQLHIQNRTGQGAGERRDASHHGHGSGDADDMSSEPQDELKQFFREVNDSVSEYIGGEEVPLVLAGVSEYLPLYREANSYPHLIENEIVSGNPEPVGPKTLHEQAWKIVEPIFLESQEREIDRFNQLYYQDDGLASDEFNEVLAGCAYGRVDTLFIPSGEYRWGRFDLESNTLELHESQQPGDGDLLNYAAISAYLNGGTVHVLQPSEMPEGRSIAATFRYSADVSAAETA